MIKKFINWYKSQWFITSWGSIFVNPYYLTRNGVFQAIKRNASLMGGNLLDFGCGSKPYKQLFSVRKYVGVDIAVSGHPHLNEKIDVYYDGKKLPFKSVSFDCVFSSEVFEHVFNLPDMLDEINRVVKKGGYGIFTMPFLWPEHEKPFDFGRYSSFGITHLLNSHGFEIVKIEKTNTDVEGITQLICDYIYRCYSPVKYIAVLLNLLIVCPITILGLILSKILPNRKESFSGMVIVVKKLK